MTWLRGYLFPAQWLDSPKILDCTVTPIPGSLAAPLQVIASLKRDIQGIQILDSTGQYIGVYEGPVGQEILRAVVGAIKPDTDVVLSKGSRISLRSIDPAAISSGSLCLQFMARI